MILEVSISNLFVRTYEQEDFCFPAPIVVHATIEKESEDTLNELEMTFSSYLDSILIFDTPFSLFFYLLTNEYKIETIFFRVVRKKKTEQEISGYKGIFEFNSGDDLIMNIGEIDIYDDYKNQIKQTNV